MDHPAGRMAGQGHPAGLALGPYRTVGACIPRGFRPVQALYTAIGAHRRSQMAIRLDQSWSHPEHPLDSYCAAALLD